MPDALQHHLETMFGAGAQFREEHRVERLPGILLLPFTGRPGNYPLNREARGPLADDPPPKNPPGVARP